MESPYVELLSAMRRQGESVNPPGIRLAEIVSPPPSIVIKMGDLQVDKNNILIADYLLPGYKRDMSGVCEGDIVTHDGSQYSPYTVLESLLHSGQIEFIDTIKPGDIVAVMPTEDRQTYIILVRVVSV